MRSERERCGEMGATCAKAEQEWSVKSSGGTTKAGMVGLPRPQEAQRWENNPLRTVATGCFIGFLRSGEVSCGSEATRRFTGEQPGGHCCNPGKRNEDVDWAIQEEGWPHQWRCSC